MTVKNANQTSAKHIVACVLLVACLVCALAIFGVELVGMSHIAGMLNYMRLN